MFCHPFWRITHGYHCSTAMTEHLMATRPFDAFELISGYNEPDVESNNLQVALYYAYTKNNETMPVVRVRDSQRHKRRVFRLVLHVGLCRICGL